MKVTISVTQEDIERGEAVNCHSCPVALAAKRALPQYPRLAAFSHGLSLDYMAADYMTAIPWPDGVRAFIRKFDDGSALSPFSFDIEVPDAI